MKSNRMMTALLTASLLAAAGAGCNHQAGTNATAGYDTADQRYAPPVTPPPESVANPGTENDPTAPAVVSNPTRNGPLESRAPEPSAPPRSTDPGVSPPGTETRGNNAAGQQEAPRPADPDLAARIARLELAINRMQDHLTEFMDRTETPARPGPIESPGAIDLAETDDSEGVSRASARGGRLLVDEEARADLDRLIRRYRRAKEEMARSEVSYKIDHFMTLLKLAELWHHGTPWTFGGLSERDRFAFRDLQAAADELSPVLKRYMENLATDEEQSDLSPLLEEVDFVIRMKPPGTGNRLLDFLMQLKVLNGQVPPESHQP